jgi:hypothetical protein
MRRGAGRTQRTLIRLSDLNPRRLKHRYLCHKNLQRCQYQDRPNDGAMTWIDKLWFFRTKKDPREYGYPSGWWDRHA